MCACEMQVRQRTAGVIRCVVAMIYCLKQLRVCARASSVHCSPRAHLCKCEKCEYGHNWLHQAMGHQLFLSAHVVVLGCRRRRASLGSGANATTQGGIIMSSAFCACTLAHATQTCNKTVRVTGGGRIAHTRALTLCIRRFTQLLLLVDRATPCRPCLDSTADHLRPFCNLISVA